MVSCAICKCNKFKSGSHKSFHRFPRDPGRRAKWLAAINRKNWTPKENDRICSDHFQNSDLNLIGCTNRLRMNVCPSLPSSESDKNSEVQHEIETVLLEEMPNVADHFYGYEDVNIKDQQNEDLLFEESETFENSYNRIGPCDLSDPEEKMFTLSNEWLKKEHSYCLPVDDSTSKALRNTVIFWKKEFKKLQFEIRIRTDEIDKINAEIESLKNQFTTKEEIFGE